MANGRVADGGGATAGDQNSLAIVGLACRYPDADDIAALFQVIVCGRRAFRWVPKARLDSADHRGGGPGGRSATGGGRAALIEGWRFDRAAFGISQASYLSTDPAQWLAMETTARALAAAGFPAGTGLPGARTGVYVGAGALASTRPGTIAAAICGHFGFGGGGYSIDAGAASSLAAIASACSALATGELDAAVAGGVDVSLDRLELADVAEPGLATRDMRIYDRNPTGFLPGEGCGMVLLMRTADATAADLPVYAEILGYGMASAGQQQRSLADPAGMLSALRRAYEDAMIDPADVQLIEGCGTGIGHADEAELTALAMLRSGASRAAGLGAVTANIGNTGAAAGAAGLIKAVLATANGVLPPTIGVATPHQILSAAKASLRVLAAPEPWPEGPRHAGVSAVSLDGLSAHMVLRGRPDARSAPTGRLTARPAAVMADLDQPSAFLVHAPDRAALAAVLSRIAAAARWLSDAQLRDLARQLAIEAAEQGRVRVAIVASRQEQLARLASEAITMLPGLTSRVMSGRPGIFAADDADGKVTVLLAGQHAEPAEAAQRELDRTLAILGRLDEFGVQPTAVVGHGLGELAALVCAGSISAEHARALNYLRADALAATTTAAPGNLSSAIDGFAGFAFGTPLCRLVSGCTGEELSSQDEIASSLTAELLDARSAADRTVTAIPAGQRLAAAVRIGASGASLLLQSGRDRDLTRAIGRLDPTRSGAGRRRQVAVVSVDGDPADDRSMARAAAALFAAGALTRANLLHAGNQARPIDIWRDPVFITRPRQVPVATQDPPSQQPAGLQRPPRAVASKRASERASERAARQAAAAPAAEPPAPAPDEPEVTGVAPWYRCYAEQTAEPVGPMAAPADGPWRVYTGGCDALHDEVVELFRHEAAAGRTLAVLGRPHDAGAVEAALLAAQDAVGTGQLLAVSPHPGWAGLWAALRAEHPATGVTTLRAQLDQQGLRAASRLGAAPGEYRELTIDAGGAVRELVMTPAAADRCGNFPLADGDVVLISRGVGAIGQALAQVLACSGAAVAFVGRDHPGRDDAVIAGLEQLRQAGAPITYEIVNPASAVALDAAVRRIERRLGPVTAVAHAVRPTPPRAVASLSPADLRAHIASEAGLLDRLVTAARGGADALRFIITFGSVTGRYGLGEAAMAALAAGMVADEGERLAAASPGCRPLHIDWHPAVPVAEASRLLLSVLGGAAELPGRLAVHGRLGLRAPRSVALGGTADPALAGRFTERVLVHYPGVELVAEATLETTTDPYLTDYTVDGARLLPPAIAIEAMAQVASALAGAPRLAASDVSMAVPIVLSGQHQAAVIRICALAADDAITVMLRSDSTGFAVDHFRATFSQQAAAPGRTIDPVAQATGTIKAGELYGPVCSQAGRFKRLATVRFAGPRAATGVLDAAAEEPWFRGSSWSEQPVLGSPAMTDAALQLAQACVPHRRLQFVGLASATFAGPGSAKAVQLNATQVTSLAGTTLVPRQRTAGQAGQDPDAVGGLPDTAWDVDAIDSSGELVACFRGLVMRDAGPLPRRTPWPGALAGNFIARAAAELGLGPDLEVRLDRRMAALSQPNSDGWVRASASDVGPPGLVLRVRAAGPVACGWRTAKQAGRKSATPEGAARWLEALDHQRARGTGPAGAASVAAAMAIASCAGQQADPRDASIEVRAVAGTDWLLVQAGSASLACAVVDIAGAGHPVAIAVMTGVLDRALAVLGSP